MNISKISSTPFRGYLTIQHKDEVHKFDTKKMKGLVYRDDGVIVDGFEEPFDLRTIILIPYKTFSKNTFMAAYKAAIQSEKAEVILKNNQ